MVCWPASMQANWLQKSYFFHRNDMLGTLVFTRSEYWASFSFSRAQSHVLVMVLFSNLLVSYSWLMRTLSYSKWVQKKLTKDKTELNHINIHVLSLICYSHLYIIMIIHSDSTINSSLQGLLTALRKPKSNPVEHVLFYSDKVKKMTPFQNMMKDENK